MGRLTTHQTDEAVDHHHLSEICSPAAHVTRIAFLVTIIVYSLVLEGPSDETAAGMSIPAGALTDKIIRLYLSPIITDITQIIILSNTDFLTYKGQ